MVRTTPSTATHLDARVVIDYASNMTADLPMKETWLGADLMIHRIRTFDAHCNSGHVQQTVAVRSRNMWTDLQATVTKYQVCRQAGVK